MAKTIKEVKRIQDQEVRLKDNITAIKSTELETRTKLYLQLQKSGGRAPTKRDELGNVILYEDPEVTGSQLLRADQLVTVELIKPDYDDAQAAEVLDSEVNELFTPTDTSELTRLRNQIEDLRNQLRDAEAGITVEEVVENVVINTSTQTPDNTDEPVFEENPRFPSNGLILPDLDGGVESDTPLEFSVNTAIFNDTDMKLEKYGGPNPFRINWWIVNRTTNEIVNSGTDDTEFGFQAPDTENIYDVVLELLQTPSNFQGWYFNDHTTGQALNYTKIDGDRIVRFQLNKQYEVGNSEIDRNRNTYQMSAVFLNQTPQELGELEIEINIDSAGAGAENNGIGSFGIAPVSFRLVEKDQGNNTVQDVTLTTPAKAIVHKGNSLEMTAPKTQRISIGEDANFTYWFVQIGQGNYFPYTQFDNTLPVTLTGLITLENFAIGYDVQTELRP